MILIKIAIDYNGFEFLNSIKIDSNHLIKILNLNIFH